MLPNRCQLLLAFQIYAMLTCTVTIAHDGLGFFGRPRRGLASKRWTRSGTCSIRSVRDSQVFSSGPYPFHLTSING